MAQSTWDSPRNSASFTTFTWQSWVLLCFLYLQGLVGIQNIRETAWVTVWEHLEEGSWRGRWKRFSASWSTRQTTQWLLPLQTPTFLVVYYLPTCPLPMVTHYSPPPTSSFCLSRHLWLTGWLRQPSREAALHLMEPALCNGLIDIPRIWLPMQSDLQIMLMAEELKCCSVSNECSMCAD